MARTVQDDEERDRRIKLVGRYRVDTGSSTRAIAKHFSETEFPISNATVSAYIEEYKKINSFAKQTIDEQTYENIPDSIKKPEIRKRTLKVAELIKQGFTIEEITKSLEEPYWVIYRDIVNRLPMIDKKLSDSINQILKERSLDNLNKNEKK